MEGAPPDFLRVEEAARILRISRTTAYREARTWLATNGAAGLPVIRLGRILRVPAPRSGAPRCPRRDLIGAAPGSTAVEARPWAGLTSAFPALFATAG